MLLLYSLRDEPAQKVLVLTYCPVALPLVVNFIFRGAKIQKIDSIKYC